MKQTLSKIALSTLIAALPFSASAHNAIEEQCERVMQDYAWYIDHPNPEGFANLFTKDATLVLNSRTMNGHEELKAFINSGSENRTAVHLMSNLRVTPTSDTTATGTSYLTVFIMPGGEGIKRVDGFSAIAEYHDEFVIDDEGCKIAKRKLIPRVIDNAVQRPDS